MKIRAGIIGLGYIGTSHMEAIRRIGFIDLTAVADPDLQMARMKAEEYGISKCYSSAAELLSKENVDVVHNCTPNNLHASINREVIKAGKHIFSEKPLSMNSAESETLLELLKENPNIVNGINFVYRMNPLIQDMKSKIMAGAIGKPFIVHGSYLQDWLLNDTDFNWRIDPDIGGPSRCIADIGSHWIDCVQTLLNTKITEVCADLEIIHKKRKRPIGQAETFSINKAGSFETVDVKTEDYGAVLFIMENGVKGVFYVSQVSAGRKCRLDIEINGSKASVYWNQEEADRMWIGYKDKHNLDVIRNPLLMDEKAKEYSYLAAGHPEGWNDAMKNNVYSFYKFISEGKTPGKNTCDFATFKEGHHIIKITEAILKSAEERKWVKV
jgi:predicted dehydrogenase